MSLYDRESGDESEGPRMRLRCRDGMCGATDCARCGHGEEPEPEDDEEEEEEADTWAGRCERIERLRKQSLATGVPVVTAVQGDGGGLRPGEMGVLTGRSNVGRSVRR